jgi:hypothetical protein
MADVNEMSVSQAVTNESSLDRRSLATDTFKTSDTFETFETFDTSETFNTFDTSDASPEPEHFLSYTTVRSSED